jgi:hypothetical protein
MSLDSPSDLVLGLLFIMPFSVKKCGCMSQLKRESCLREWTGSMRSYEILLICKENTSTARHLVKRRCYAYVRLVIGSLRFTLAVTLAAKEMNCQHINHLILPSPCDRACCRMRIEFIVLRFPSNLNYDDSDADNFITVRSPTSRSNDILRQYVARTNNLPVAKTTKDTVTSRRANHARLARQWARLMGRILPSTRLFRRAFKTAESLSTTPLPAIAPRNLLWSY